MHWNSLTHTHTHTYTLTLAHTLLSLTLSLSPSVSVSVCVCVCACVCVYVCVYATARTEFSHRKREASRKRDMCRRRRRRRRRPRFTWPVLHPWRPAAAGVVPRAVSSYSPTWPVPLCRSDAEERPPTSTRTRSRCCSDCCCRWSLACLASETATAFETASTRTGLTISRRAAARCCSPPSVACPWGTRPRQRTPIRTDRRTCRRPPSGSVGRCYFVSPRSRSAVSNARRLVSFIRGQLPTEKTKQRETMVNRLDSALPFSFCCWATALSITCAGE